MTNLAYTNRRASFKSLSRRASFSVPALLFAGLALTFGWALSNDPQNMPSAMIGRPVPVFNLPPVQGRTLGLSSENLVGEVSLVNVFASWCTACRAEHPLFMQLSANKTVPIHGLNYKDQPANAAKWLDELGDPYARTGADLKGRVSIDWGVFGVPETFVIAPDGKIAYRHVGPVTKQIFGDIILPLIIELRRSGRWESKKS
ncbi:MAG: DsbE family thiol:disulfide interchange protein [Geminicoccales bacterium]